MRLFPQIRRFPDPRSRSPGGRGAVVLFLALALAAAPAQALVKKSASDICHAPDSPWFSRTTHFQAFDTLQACLASGGRLPKGKRAGAEIPAGTPAGGGPGAGPAYDRAAFGSGWADADGDCRNTRHEILAQMSTGPVIWSAGGCSVVHGRWIDPYSGHIHLEARNLDIDHVVPLHFAWMHGAVSWPPARRAAFANDPVNLLPVEAAINREKGARGPLDWLPPAKGFRCQYMLRFRRISTSYGLVFSDRERQAMAALTTELCR